MILLESFLLEFKILHVINIYCVRFNTNEIKIKFLKKVIFKTVIIFAIQSKLKYLFDYILWHQNESKKKSNRNFHNLSFSINLTELKFPFVKRKQLKSSAYIPPGIILRK